MDRVASYIDRVTGQQISFQIVEEDPALGQLPAYLLHAFSFFLSSFLGRPIVFAVAKGDESFSPRQYHTVSGLVEKAFERSAIFVLPETVPAYIRQRISAYRVSFIVPDKQLFLPTLLIDLHERNKGILPKSGPTLSVPAQLLVLYSLQKSSLEGLSQKEIVRKIGYSAMTISRAVRELASRGIASLPQGKEKRVHFEVSEKALWEKALPLLTSPVKKRLLLLHDCPEPPGILSSYSALAEYSMLSAENRSYYAITENEQRSFLAEGVAAEVPDDRESTVLEVWRYDPSLLASDGMVDPLSLFLALKDDPNERVQGALEEMMENKISWR